MKVLARPDFAFVRACPHCGSFTVTQLDDDRTCHDDGHDMIHVMTLDPWLALDSLLRGDLLRDDLAKQIKRIRRALHE